MWLEGKTRGVWISFPSPSSVPIRITYVRCQIIAYDLILFSICVNPDNNCILCIAFFWLYIARTLEFWQIHGYTFRFDIFNII